jgi:CO/xanthine dehydrogenase Mo-binding subunit/CO/xanthine dehydrogenase FAD-binding subunit
MIGVAARPIDWDARTAGRLEYTADLDLPGLLLGGIVRSPWPFARLREVDVTAALEVPGVHAAITASDFPPALTYQHRGPQYADRAPLARGQVRYVGEEIAAVAADSEAALRTGLAAVRVDLARRRRVPLTMLEAVADGMAGLHARGGSGSNVAVAVGAEWGAPRDDRARLHHVDGIYEYPAVSHAAMEPNATIAWWHADSSTLELWTSTQAPWFIAWEVAHCLGIDQADVVCREVGVGGGFGAKSKIGEHEVLAAALSRATRRPVLVRLSRFDEFSYAKRRHAARIAVGLYADDDGRLRWIKGHVDLDNGGYNHMGPSVLHAAVDTLGAIYQPAGVQASGRLIYTATQPGGPFRGYGAPQATFALESEVDRLAHVVGMDPLEFRLANANEPFSRAQNGSAYTTAGLRSCLVAVRDRLDWKRPASERGAGRGLGVAAAAHGGGAYAYPRANESESTVEVDVAGRVVVRYGGADAGTGQSTVLAQIAAEALGVPLEHVSVVSMDSTETPFDLGAWSSRGTHMSGNAVLLAARALGERLRAPARELLGCEEVRLAGGRALGSTGSVALGDVVRAAGQGDSLSETRTYVAEHVQRVGFTDGKPANTYADYAFTAHGVDLELDERTGCFAIRSYVAAQDTGRLVNPVQALGQVRGAVVMGLGAVRGEELSRVEGRVATASYLDYPCPRAADVPDVTVDLIQEPDPLNPLGTKNVGEIGLVPVGPAVANALHDAAGIRLRSLPATPDKVLDALARRDGRHRNFRISRRPRRWWIALMRWAYPRGLHFLLDRWGVKLARTLEPAPVDELVAPTELTDALGALDGDAAPIAGGTDLLLQREQKLRSFRRMVDLGGVAELSGIHETHDGLSIGANVTLTDLAGCAAVPPIVAQTIATIATPQARNVATVGGNLLQAKRCWYYRNGFNCYKRGGRSCPCYAVLGDHRFYHAAVGAHRCQAVTPSDLATTLVALDAEATIAGPRGRRIVPVADLYSGPGETQLEAGELLVEVRIPRAARHRRGSFRKLNLYDGGFAAAAVALTSDDASSRFADVRLVVGAVAPVPWRPAGAERALEGRRLGAESVRAALDAELTRSAHPLARNGWKLDAVLGLAMHAADDLNPSRRDDGA